MASDVDKIEEKIKKYKSELKKDGLSKKDKEGMLVTMRILEATWEEKNVMYLKADDLFYIMLDHEFPDYDLFGGEICEGFQVIRKHSSDSDQRIISWHSCR